MTIKEAEQFMIDPLPDIDEEVLVKAGWLQKLLRENQSMKRDGGILVDKLNKQSEYVSSLKHRLMVAESTQPYTRVIDTKA